jgi:hypothetical protein
VDYFRGLYAPNLQSSSNQSTEEPWMGDDRWVLTMNFELASLLGKQVRHQHLPKQRVQPNVDSDARKPFPVIHVQGRWLMAIPLLLLLCLPALAQTSTTEFLPEIDADF